MSEKEKEEKKRNSWKWKSKQNSQYCSKIRDFNKQQKGKGIRILTPKQMLQRLPVALAKVNAGNTSYII